MIWNRINNIIRMPQEKVEVEKTEEKSNKIFIFELSFETTLTSSIHSVKKEPGIDH